MTNKILYFLQELDKPAYKEIDNKKFFEINRPLSLVIKHAKNHPQEIFIFIAKSECIL